MGNEYGLKEIVSAFCDCDFAEINRYDFDTVYYRARALRREGVIRSSCPQASAPNPQMFTEADAVAAVLALTINLNGAKSGRMGVVNSRLRTIGNTQGQPKFEEYLGAIKSGDSVYVRLDIYRMPKGDAKPFIGTDVCDFTLFPLTPGTTETNIWPLTSIAKPVLEMLKERIEE